MLTVGTSGRRLGILCTKKFITKKKKKKDNRTPDNVQSGVT